MEVGCLFEETCLQRTAVPDLGRRYAALDQTSTVCGADTADSQEEAGDHYLWG